MLNHCAKRALLLTQAANVSSWGQCSYEEGCDINHEGVLWYQHQLSVPCHLPQDTVQKGMRVNVASHLGNGRQCCQKIPKEGVMADVEVCYEAAIHDQLPLQIVHHTESHAEPHADVNPVHQPWTVHVG